MKNAHEELLDYLIPGEDVEAIIFGPWGWGSAPDYPTAGTVPGSLQGNARSNSHRGSIGEP